MSLKRLNAGPRMSGAVVNGNTVYLAGQVADGANVKAQTEAVLKKIDDLLGAAGTSKANLLATTIYLSDIRTFDEMPGCRRATRRRGPRSRRAWRIRSTWSRSWSPPRYRVGPRGEVRHG